MQILTAYLRLRREYRAFSWPSCSIASNSRSQMLFVMQFST
jgi:hypothetical protein